MSSIAIETYNLGKQYHIGSLQQQEDTLAAQVINSVKAPIRRVGKLLSGQATGAAELDETIWALRDVSVQIRPGETVGVIGRNGAGKSTFLKVLSRITEPSAGNATIHGRVGSLLEVGTGFHPELTGRENVFLNGAILGMTRADIQKKFDEIVEFAEVNQFIDTPVKHYSSGMYVRLAFSVAAHLEPEVLLVDEVLAVGDLAFQRKCLGKMDDVAQTGRTVLFVSHNMALIQSLCSRGIFLKDGMVAADGNVSNTVTTYLETLQKISVTDVRERTDRSGAGDVRLIGLDILQGNENTQSRSTFKVGTPIRFAFELDKLMNGLSCMFVVINHLGQRVAVFKSKVVGPEDGVDTGIGSRFICEMDKLLLMPGRYHINVLVQGGNEKQDYVEAATVFDVEEGHLDGRPMKFNRRVSVCMPHRWTRPTEV